MYRNEMRRRGKNYDGPDYDRNISSLRWVGCLADPLVRQTGECERIGGRIMAILAVIVLFLGGYLLYALVHPEKF